MSSSALSTKEARLHLLWSLWAEMGVPGAVHAHPHTAIDPEWLVLYTPLLGMGDARLLEMSFAWCAQHGQHGLQRKRLTGLSKTMSSSARQAFNTVAERLTPHAPQLWGPTRSNTPMPELDTMRQVAFRVDRPSMVVLRARMLFGLSARPDILCALLSQPDRMLTAEDVKHLGFSRRTVSRVLADLVSSGVLSGRQDGYRNTFRLQNPDELTRLFQAEGLQWTPWHLVMPLLTAMLPLDPPPESEGLGRITANQVREAVLPLVHRMVIKPPPTTAGNPRAFSDIHAWGQTLLNRLASGVMPKGSA